MVAIVLSAQGHNKYCISFPPHLGKLRPSEFEQELSGHFTSLGHACWFHSKQPQGFQGSRTKACPYQPAEDHSRQTAGAQKDPIPINRTDTLKKLQCVESLAELTLKYCLSFLLVTLRKSPNRSTLREKGLISSCRPSLWGNPGCRNRRQLERLNPQS